MSCSRTQSSASGETRTCNPSFSSQAPYCGATAQLKSKCVKSPGVDYRMSAACGKAMKELRSDFFYLLI